MAEQTEPDWTKPCNCTWQYGSTKCPRHKAYDEWQAGEPAGKGA